MSPITPLGGWQFFCPYRDRYFSLDDERCFHGLTYCGECDPCTCKRCFVVGGSGVLAKAVDEIDRTMPPALGPAFSPRDPTR